MFIIRSILTIVFITNYVASQNVDKFKQLDQEIATPNLYRTASGYPGHGYWQNRADYTIDVKLNDDNQSIDGFETITYTNNSPDNLNYLWVQLDQNVRAKDSDSYKISTGKMRNKLDFTSIKPGYIIGDKDASEILNKFDGGFNIEEVVAIDGRKLNYVINKTMMRIDLKKPMKPGAKMSISIRWNYKVQDRVFMGGRPGYEFFRSDSNYLYTICQWFPRMAMYNDVYGWQNKQFLGRGEFTLDFGNYDVRITVPADHIVAATGELQNSMEVLTKSQVDRFKKSKSSPEPVIIITQDEAEQNEKSRSNKFKTWRYKAKNVRDFAFTSSRKFIWDAMGVKLGNRTVMAMSYYPKEANPLYERYSTRAVAHTLRAYSKYTFDYPYPVAISVEASNGMEYPMICFNYGRPEKDGTYTERTKYGMISVIIHEVGHNYFPMIVNSDERQWTWMDEGLNSYLQFLTEQEWDREYPSWRGPPKNIVNYMKGDKNNLAPIMTNSESIYQFGNNAYGKPATALNILRETVVGRELFDFAFKEYSTRWMFKRPEPADFFRSMEDASGVDLDWFWRGWFYTTKNVDVAMKSLRLYQIDTKDPDIEKPLKKEKREENEAKDLIDSRNEPLPKLVDKNRELLDFYNKFDPLDVTKSDRREYNEFLKSLEPEELKLLSLRRKFYVIEIENIGGLVSPVILDITYADGKRGIVRIPAEIWKRNTKTVKKLVVAKKEITQIEIDPMLETADTDRNNNYWPPRPIESRFQLQKRKKEKNPMQKSNEEENRSKEQKNEKKKKSSGKD